MKGLPDCTSVISRLDSPLTSIRPPRSAGLSACTHHHAASSRPTQSSSLYTGPSTSHLWCTPPITHIYTFCNQKKWRSSRVAPSCCPTRPAGRRSDRCTPPGMTPPPSTACMIHVAQEKGTRAPITQHDGCLHRPHASQAITPFNLASLSQPRAMLERGYG